MLEKIEGRSRIYNPETLATLGTTQDTGHRNKAHNAVRKQRMSNIDPPQNWGMN